MKFKIINLSETDKLLKSNHTKPVTQINDKLPWSLWRIRSVKEIHTGSVNRTRGALAQTQKSDLNWPINKLYSVKRIQCIDDCSLLNMKRHRQAAAAVGELKWKFTN